MTARQSSQVVTDSFSYVRGFGGVFAFVSWFWLVGLGLGLSGPEEGTNGAEHELAEFSSMRTNTRPTDTQKKKRCTCT